MKSVLRFALTAAIAASSFSPMMRAQAAPAPTLSNITPHISDLNPFPPPDAKNFTADFPTKETVKAFLNQIWGYDPSRIYEVEAIAKTPVETISQVVVYVSQTGLPADQTKIFAFLVLKDGKHAIAGDTIMDFGATPFADKRATLQARADGPSYGSASKSLELVEFADLQCPHCKDAQSKMDQLAQDYPMAHIVFQNYPIVQLHPSAFQAAAYGLCVAQMKPDAGNAAFHTYVQAVFDTQEALTPDGTKQTLNDAATKAGVDAAKVAACAATEAIKTQVQNSVQLAKDLQVDSTPTLMINGRSIPLAGVTYEVLKTIINYQARLDGITLPTPPAAALNLTAPALK